MRYKVYHDFTAAIIDPSAAELFAGLLQTQSYSAYIFWGHDLTICVMGWGIT